MSFELDAEIFAVGKWNGIDVTPQMLKELESNFTSLMEVIDVPLKLGHNEEQPLTDGQPALGWIDKVWVEGQKLFAHFKGMPKIVYDAIDKELFKNVSIEALFDVTHKGKDYGTVLTAVALLGVDMPAVNTLSDLKTYMTNKNVSFSNLATFSKKPVSINDERRGIMPLTPEEQAEFDALKAKNEALETENKENATKMAKFTSTQNELQAQINEMKEKDEEAKFTAATDTMKQDLEGLVKAGTIAPAKRDELLGTVTKENLAQVQFSVNLLKDSTKKVDMTKDLEDGKDDKDKDKKDLSASDQVIQKAREFSNTNKVSFSAAVTEVLRQDPELAREYADENDGGE